MEIKHRVLRDTSGVLVLVVHMGTDSMLVTYQKTSRSFTGLSDKIGLFDSSKPLPQEWFNELVKFLEYFV